MTPGKRVLVVGHDHVAGLGHVGEGLEQRGWTLEWFTVVPQERFTEPDVEVRFPDPRTWDLVITLGAPWPRRDISTWWPAEVDFLREARASGVPVLGICFGAQLLAEARGGATVGLETPKVGWFEIEPMIDGVPAGPWFHWNGDQLVPPPGATVLARTSDGCAAFAVEGAVGLQFHPEMTEPLLRRWLSVPGSVRDGSADRLLDAAAAIDGADLRERVDLLLGTVLARLF